MSFCFWLPSLFFKNGEIGLALNTVVARGNDDAGPPFLIDGRVFTESFGALLGFGNFAIVKGDGISGNLLGFDVFSRGSGGEWCGELSSLFDMLLFRC